jgi:hypothetical protein
MSVNESEIVPNAANPAPAIVKPSLKNIKNLSRIFTKNDYFNIVDPFLLVNMINDSSYIDKGSWENINTFLKTILREAAIDFSKVFLNEKSLKDFFTTIFNSESFVTM